MPSFVHDGIALLFRERPELAPLLVESALGIELPRHREAVLETVDLTDMRPATRYADAVVVLRDEREPVHALVLEVQLAVDEEKLRSWPAYGANLRRQLGCTADVLVVTPVRSVARWAERPIVMGTRSVFCPLVIGPDRMPRVTEQEARRCTELAVLSAMAHARAPLEVAVESAWTALDAVRDLEEARALLYMDLVWAGLSKAARKALEALMESRRYEYRSEFARKYFGAGKAEGRAEGKADLLSKQLRLKFGELSPEVRERLSGAGLEELDRWAERILDAESIDDGFGDEG